MWANHKFLCFVLAQHDVRRRKLFAVVMYDRWMERRFLSTSMSAILLNNCRSFCQSVLHAGCSPVRFVASSVFMFIKRCLLLLVDCVYTSVQTHHIYLSRPLPSSHRLSWTEYCHISVVSLIIAVQVAFSFF